MKQRSRILLIPQFTELEWTIAPLLAEWADVATFDIPGVGSEPMPRGDREITRELVADRGLQEIDARGWQSYFVVGDGSGNAAAVRLARRRPAAVTGVALGHASLSYETEGERPPLNGEIYAAMGQLLHNDYESFVRYGITQMTQGSFDEELAERMVQRFPSMPIAAQAWDALHAQHEPIGEMLQKLDKPLLLGKHEGCLGFTPEGYEDAIAAFPGAQTIATQRACCSDPAFAEALRSFCMEAIDAAAG